MKRCKTCRIEWPETDFYPTSHASGVRNTECKACANERRRRNRARARVAA